MAMFTARSSTGPCWTSCHEPPGSSQGESRSAQNGVAPVNATARLLQSHRPGDEPLRVLSASGQLGYGIPEDAFRRGMAHAPHVIGCDMGSIDPGPYYLGAGVMAAPESMVERDLELVLCAAREADVPLIIGSAGTAGAGVHLDATLAIVQRIVARRGLRLRLATIRSDIPAAQVVSALHAGALDAIGAIDQPSPDAIEACSHIVGQCGTETFERALALDPDVVIAGRACDTAIFATLPAMLGYPLGLCLHMAKIIECTSLCCRPGGRDAMLAELTPAHFTLASMNPDAHATPASVAAHALYEQADPLQVEEPGGSLMLHDAWYEALDAHRTRVGGARFLPRERPSLKVEGASWLGERVVLLAGVADPVLLRVLPQAIAEVEQRVRTLVAGDWQLFAHVYGQGAVRELAPALQATHEAGLVLEFIAPQAALARTAAGVFKQNLLHHAYPGRIATGGNLAFAFTPSEIDAQSAYRFVLYHVMRDAPLDMLFPVAATDLDGRSHH